MNTQHDRGIPSINQIDQNLDLEVQVKPLIRIEHDSPYHSNEKGCSNLENVSLLLHTY